MKEIDKFVRIHVTKCNITRSRFQLTRVIVIVRSLNTIVIKFNTPLTLSADLVEVFNFFSYRRRRKIANAFNEPMKLMDEIHDNMLNSLVKLRREVQTNGYHEGISDIGLCALDARRVCNRQRRTLYSYCQQHKRYSRSYGSDFENDLSKFHKAIAKYFECGGEYSHSLANLLQRLPNGHVNSYSGYFQNRDQLASLIDGDIEKYIDLYTRVRDSYNTARYIFNFSQNDGSIVRS